MERKEGKNNGQIEINDLIDDAVKNAVARRNQSLDSEDALSDEEMKSVAGGTASNLFTLPILTTMGIIAYPDQTLLS